MSAETREPNVGLVMDQECKAGYNVITQWRQSGVCLCPRRFTGASFDASMPIDNCQWKF